MNAWEAGLFEPLQKFIRNPSDLSAVQSMYECFTKDEKAQATISKHMLANEGFKAMYDAWYTPAPYTLDQLLELPANTFGHTYAAHMKAANLSLDFISPFKGRDVLSYMWLRANHVHDISHVLTGYDTSFLGELGLKGYELAQYRSPSTAAVIGAGYLAVTSMNPELIGPIMDAMLEGYALGKRNPLLMGIQWDKEWATPMADLKAKYQLVFRST